LKRLEVGLALIHSFHTASAMPLCLRRWIVPLLLDHTDISIAQQKRIARSCLRLHSFLVPFWCWPTRVVPDKIQEGCKMVVSMCVT